VFFRDTEMQAAVILLDLYLKRNNCNYLFYIAISLILLKEEVIRFSIVSNP